MTKLIIELSAIIAENIDIKKLTPKINKYMPKTKRNFLLKVCFSEIQNAFIGFFDSKNNAAG